MNTQSLANQDESQKALVAILNLQVILAPDGGQWTAQAIEIDYAAGGTSEEDAKSRFESGLCATIHEHLARFGSLEHLLTPAPQELWVDLASPQRFSQLSFHRFTPQHLEFSALPFGGIAYLHQAHA